MTVRLAAAWIALLLVLAGCGSAPTAVGPAALEFQGGTVDGAAFDGRELAGAPTVLWFWAPF